MPLRLTGSLPQFWSLSCICEEGFAYWIEGAGDAIPLLLRGTDRCNGIEPLGYRPGHALMWALIEDVFFADDRAAVIAEVAEAFGPPLADRLEAAEPPPHRVLCRRLDRSPYAGLAAFSRWALGDVSNEVICSCGPPASSENVVYMSPT